MNAPVPWYASGPFWALLGVVIGALVSFGGNWYLKRMDRDSWLGQKRWELKWHCYSQMAEHYGELHTLISELIGVTNTIAQHPTDRLTAERDRLLVAIRERFELARRYGSIARIIVPPEVRTFLTGFGNRWMAAQGDPVAQGTAARDTWMGILDRGREDLGFEQREMP